MQSRPARPARNRILDRYELAPGPNSSRGARRGFLVGAARAAGSEAAQLDLQEAGKRLPFLLSTGEGLMPRKKIDFDHVGIGALLRLGRLRVPPNQRSYKWKEEHVSDLFQDFAKAIDDEDYFLGTIVLTDTASPIPEVTDGQQRLATTTILLSAIRDAMMAARGRTRAVGQLESDFLMFSDYGTDEIIPRLTLNTDDAQYMIDSIIAPPEERSQPTLHGLPESNKRLADAFRLANAHVESIIAPLRDSDRDSVLAKWIAFIQDRATVIAIKVPDATSAFRMFATLNDRGLRASQADVIKNYLFARSGSRLTEAAGRWSSMTGAIETVGDDDLVLLYLRHYWVTKHGPTKEEDLADEIEGDVRSAQGAMAMLRQLDDDAADYVALFNPDHSKWNRYKSVIRSYVRTIYHDLKVEQIRPLLFAISRSFSPAEAVRAFQLCVDWSVRFLVAGGRGGFLDRHYGLRAEAVGTGQINTADELADVMRPLVPNDTQFEEAFWKLTVSQSSLARYYLRTLDAVMSGDSEPQYVPNPETEVVNLEHIMPKSPNDHWDIHPDVAAANVKRLGNMVLMQASSNVAVGNDAFDVKRAEYVDAVFPITKSVASFSNWGPSEIDARQKELAAVAVKAWPVNLGAKRGRTRRRA